MTQNDLYVLAARLGVDKIILYHDPLTGLNPQVIVRSGNSYKSAHVDSLSDDHGICQTINHLVEEFRPKKPRPKVARRFVRQGRQPAPLI